MAQKEVVTLECDLCGVEGPAEPADGSEPAMQDHTISFDGRATRVIDACGNCWVPYQAMLEKLIDAGRSAKRASAGKRRLASVS